MHHVRHSAITRTQRDSSPLYGVSDHQQCGLKRGTFGAHFFREGRHISCIKGEERVASSPGFQGDQTFPANKISFSLTGFQNFGLVEYFSYNNVFHIHIIS